MSIGTLAIFPADADAAPPPEALLKQLRQIGLCDSPIKQRQHRYSAGPHFINLLTFVGCSPHIRLQPTDDNDQDYCHIELLGPLAQTGLLRGSNTRPPRCGACRQAIDDGSAPKAHSTPPAATITCPHCQYHNTPAQLNWRQQAGAARMFILVHNIFPGEAIPTEGLLSALDQVHPGWHFCYVQQPALR